MQVGQFGSRIVIAWSGNDGAAFHCAHTFDLGQTEQRRHLQDWLTECL